MCVYIQYIQGSRLRPFFESVRVKIWPWSALLQSARCQPQHIVAGERFHWSREERRFQHERFSRAWFTPVSHRTRMQSRGSAEAARMQSGSSAEAARMQSGSSARPLCFHSRVSTSAKVHAADVAQWRIWFSNWSKRPLLKPEKVNMLVFL